MIRPTVFTKSKKPALIAAVMRANLAGCAYQDMDLNEQNREIKKSLNASK